MKTKIALKNLNKRATSHDGEVKTYSVDLDDCILINENKEKISSLKNELRAILRSEQNLQEAIEMIDLLESNLRNEDRHEDWKNVGAETFSTGCILPSFGDVFRDVQRNFRQCKIST